MTLRHSNAPSQVEVYTRAAFGARSLIRLLVIGKAELPCGGRRRQLGLRVRI